LLIALGSVLGGIVYAGIAIYGIYYMVRAFIDGSILIGIITIPVTLLCIGIAHLIVGVISMPFIALLYKLFVWAEDIEDD